MKKKSIRVEKYESVEAFGRAMGVSGLDLEILWQKKKLSRRLREARIRQGLSQAEVARRAGTLQPAIARMETGLVSQVSMDFLIRAAWVLGVTVRLTPPPKLAA